MTRENVALTTKDGVCAVSVHRPEGTGPFPPVLLAMDGFGPRASLLAVADRIASAGYVVALPDLFYRGGSVLDLLPPGTPHDAGAMFPLVMGNPELRAQWRDRLYGPATNAANVESDLGAVLELLRVRSDVRPGAAGGGGYCMGGNIALRAAAIFGTRIAAAGVFHGGNLAVDAPDSPHHGAPKIKARVFVAGAIEDPSFTDEMKDRLEKALTDAKVPHVIETYPAKHGFCVSDMPTYDAAAAERHYDAVTSLFKQTL